MAHSDLLRFGLVGGIALLFFAPILPAQAPAEPAACTVRTAPLSSGEKALIQHDLPKAESLLRTEASAAGPEDGNRLHNELIRTLLLENNTKDAEADANAWVKAQPQNGWAEISLAEVQWKEGLVTETYASIVAASKLGSCNPQVNVDLGKIMRFSGLNAAAKRQFDRAHRLDPIDHTISDDWLLYQPRDVKLEALTRFLSTSDFLTQDERKSLEQYKDRLSAPPVANRCHLVGTTAATSIPLRPIQEGPGLSTTWGLSASFDGQGRILEVDTGAHGLLLTRSAANSLHLNVEETTEIQGIGNAGAVATTIARVNSIKIGSLEFQNCTVKILQKNPAAMSAEDGLIGGDVFSSFLLTLDFPGRMLKLDQLPSIPDTTAGPLALATGVSTEDHAAQDRYIDPGMKNWTKVFRSGHSLIVPVALNKSPARLFLLDTGSALNLVSWQMAKQYAEVSKGSNLRVWGLSGKVEQTYTTGPISLSFAGLRQQSDGLIALDTSYLGRNMGVEIAGLLGAPILHVLTVQIDYRDDLVNFTYDPKRLVHCVDGANLPDCVN